jgi:hypothetical protein
MQSFSETFLILSRNKRDVIINVHRSAVYITRYFCHIFMTLGISGQIFKKYSNIKFHEIIRVVAKLFHGGGQTDRQT